MENKDGVYEIDLLKLAKALWHNALLICFISLLGFGAGFGVARYLVTPQYQSDVMFYVNNKMNITGSISISSSDLNASKSLVDTYMVILKSRTTLNEIARKANVPYTTAQLSQMIHSASVNNTEIFRITVTSPSALEAKNIANTIATVLPDKIGDIIDGCSARVVDYAVEARNQSYPSEARFAAIGALLGFVLCSAIICILELMDDGVKSSKDLQDNFDVPILAVIPNLSMEDKDAAYKNYGYDSSQNSKKNRKK